MAITTAVHTNLPEGITQAELDKYARVDAAIKRLEPEKKRLNDKIKRAFTELGTFLCGSVVVKRTQADSFDAVAFADKYPESKYPQYYKSVVDPTKIDAKTKSKFVSKTQRLAIETVIIADADTGEVS